MVRESSVRIPFSYDMGFFRKHLKTRINASGYKQFWDARTGRWEFAHRRAAENKMGGPIRRGYEIHHKDGDKTNNRHDNLIAMPREEHRHVHALKNEIEAKRERARYASPRARRAIYREIDAMRDEVEYRENRYRRRRW